MNPRQLTCVFLHATGVPLAIGLTQLVAAAVPPVAAALVGAGLCSYAGFSLIRSVLHLFEES